MSSWMRRLSDLIPQGLASGVSEGVDTGTAFLDGVANSDMLRQVGRGVDLPGLEPSPLLDARLLTGWMADTDQRDGQQVIVANTGDDMDLWTSVTGQEQAEGGLEDVVDAFARNADGAPVDSVEFKSHGWENGQHVAAGAGGTLSGGLTDDQAAQFARLGEIVDEDGEILMAGCNVGKDYTDHHAAGDSMLDDIAEASGRSVRAGVAIQLPFDGIEGSSVVVHPDGSYELDTSCAKQVYDVTANGAAELMGAVTDSRSSWTDRVSEGAGIVGGMASDYWDIASDWWNGTHEAEGWDMLSPEQRANLET